MEIREIFARNLRVFRNRRKLSQEELAHRVGINRGYISSLERELYSPSIDTVDRIAKVLEVDICALLKAPPDDGKRDTAADP